MSDQIIHRAKIEDGGKPTLDDSPTLLFPWWSFSKTVLAASMAINPEAVGIKATTNESIGPIGRGEGIAAQAVCLLMPKTPRRD